MPVFCVWLLVLLLATAVYAPLPPACEVATDLDSASQQAPYLSVDDVCSCPSVLESLVPVTTGGLACQCDSPTAISLALLPAQRSLAIVIDTSGSVHTSAVWRALEHAKSHGLVTNYLLATWHSLAVQQFSTVEAVKAALPQALQGPNARLAADPTESHDDWQYALDAMGSVVNLMQEGYVLLFTDDDLVCDATAHSHTTQAAQLTDYAAHHSISISIIPSPCYCAAGVCTPAVGLATLQQMTAATQGAFYSGTALDGVAYVHAQVFAVSHNVSLVCECPVGSLLNSAHSGCDDINECASNPCGTHGACVNGENEFTCACASGWVGTQCQSQPCDSAPCQHGGVCALLGDTSFRCSCADGWTGITCQTPCFISSTAAATPTLGLMVDTSDRLAFLLTVVSYVVTGLDPNIGFVQFALTTFGVLNASLPVTGLGLGDLETVLGDVSYGYNARLGQDPFHSHDDWGYMLDSLEPLVSVLPDESSLLIIADDDALCDGDYFGVQQPRLDALLSAALAKHLMLFYVAYPSPCAHTEFGSEVNARAAVVTLTSALRGSAFFPPAGATVTVADIAASTAIQTVLTMNSVLAIQLCHPVTD